MLDREVPGHRRGDPRRRDGARACRPPRCRAGSAGVAGRTVVVNLPGSTGGCRDGLAVLGPVLAHAVSQVRGGDHPRPG